MKRTQVNFCFIVLLCVVAIMAIFLAVLPQSKIAFAEKWEPEEFERSEYDDYTDSDVIEGNERFDPLTVWIASLRSQ